MNQRTIKFRAWDKDRKRMVQGGLSFDYENQIHEEENIGVNNLYGAESEQIEEFELMQFTGLLDKNGKEIYEGDVLTMLNINYLVEWNDKKGRWNFYNPILSHPSYWGLTAGQMKRCEVIGNIYENPNLLK